MVPPLFAAPLRARPWREASREKRRCPPRLVNGSTRPVLLRTELTAISRQLMADGSFPFFRRLGGLLGTGGVPRAFHQPPARCGAVPVRTCPRRSRSTTDLRQIAPWCQSELRNPFLLQCFDDFIDDIDVVDVVDVVEVLDERINHIRQPKHRANVMLRSQKGGGNLSA